MKCVICQNEDVVYSGVDAFVLGIPTERIGYTCAGIYNKVIGELERYAQKVEVSQ